MNIKFKDLEPKLKDCIFTIVKAIVILQAQVSAQQKEINRLKRRIKKCF